MDYIIIKDYLYIKYIKIELDNFTVISGDSGSGKSLVISAIKALFNTKDNNFKNSYIELYINNTNYIRNNNIYYINNNKINKKEFINIINNIIMICNQHDHKLLLDYKNHINIIDSLIDNNLLKEYELLNNKYNKLNRELDDLNISYNKIDIEYINYQLDNINNVNLDEDYYNNLLIDYSNNKSNINKLECIKSFLNLSNLDNIYDAMIVLKDIDKDMFTKYNLAYNDIYSINSALINDMKVNSNNEYECIEKELSLYKALFRRYNMNINQLIDYKYRLDNDLNIYNNYNSIKNDLLNNINTININIYSIVEQINKSRELVINRITDVINNNLKLLNLNNSIFKILYNKTNDKLSNDCIFYININNKEYQRIDKQISGGELSRVLLCIKLAIIDNHKLIIFDEIDSGTSGDIAFNIGKLINSISNTYKVLLISHIPQVLIWGNKHYKIIKNDNEVNSIQLDNNQIIDNLAYLSTNSNSDDSINAIIRLQNMVKSC